MWLGRFATSVGDADRAERLADALYLGPQARERGARPFALDYQIVGVGLVAREEMTVPLLAVAANGLDRLEAGQLRSIGDTVIAARAIELVTDGNVEAWRDTLVMGIPKPTLQLTRGDDVQAAMTGSCGARVSWGGNKRGFLTAGHVAQLNQAVFDSHGQVGTCVLSLDPSTSASGMDVAVVELSPGATYSPAAAQAQFQKTVPPHQSIVIHRGSRRGGPAQAQVHGMFSWLYFPTPKAGTCADLFFTTQQVTQNGDSGSLACDPASGDLIGHVVGAIGQCGTLIQDISAQLRVICSVLGFGSLTI